MWYQAVHTISVAGVQIQVWGMMLALGSILGWLLLDYNLLWRRIKIDTSWLVMGFIFFSLVGARLMHVLLNLDVYSQNWIDILYVWNGGMASLGGFVFGFGFIWLYQKKYLPNRADDFWDATVPSMTLALFLTRVGCFLINDHIGKPIDAAWGIWSYGALRHPIIIYYVLLALVLFVISINLYYRGVLRGKILWLILIIYGISRILIDVLFKDFMGHTYSFWTTVVTCSFFVVFAIFVIFRKPGAVS